jgi:ABC-type phosphate transport system auxiliary subunit
MNQAKDLFQLQAELIDMKVDMAVTKAIDSVVQQLVELRSEMRRDTHRLENKIQSEVHELKSDMNNRFSSLENRVIAVETKLGMVNKVRDGIRDHIIDYAFKGVWLALTVVFLFMVSHVQLTIH